MKRCPHCAAEIQDTEVVCMFCCRSLAGTRVPSLPIAEQLPPHRSGRGRLTVGSRRFLWCVVAAVFFAVVVVTGMSIAAVLLWIAAMVALMVVLFWGFVYVRQNYDIKEQIRKFGPLIATIDIVWILFGFIYTMNKDGRWLLIVIAGLALRTILFKRRARRRGLPDQPPSA
jgi:cobalamin synthase